jgi:cytochrome P450
MTVVGRPTLDFDQHSQDYKHNWVQMAADVHATGNPIFWTPHHGGYWVVASWEGVHAVGSDWKTFTSENDVAGTGNGGKGQMIPPNSYALALGESDPPLHTQRRRLEAPFFTPKALRSWRPKVREHLLEALNQIAGRGAADLIDDVIIPTTARTTLFVVGYGADDWEDAAAAAHLSSFILPGQPGFPMDEMVRLRGKFRDMVESRRETPTGDIISALAHGEVNGVPVSTDDAESMMNALVFGGFDTTTAATASALIYLDQHPEQRRRVSQDEAYRKNAVEEILRTMPTASGMARTAVQDTQFMGQHIAAGERVFMWLAAANRDPLVFPDPDTVDLERANAVDHVTFSTGHHRCLGSPLAKIEISAMLETILTEFSDMRIDHEAIERYPHLGLVNGYSRVPVTFTPRGPIPLDTPAGA